MVEVKNVTNCQIFIGEYRKWSCPNLLYTSTTPYSFYLLPPFLT